jgi:hypothetical protein
VSVWVEGNTNSSEFDNAVQDCFVSVGHDIFCSLFDEFEGYEWINLESSSGESFSSDSDEEGSFSKTEFAGEGGEKQIINPGSLRFKIETEGFKIVYVKEPKKEMSRSGGLGGYHRNFNDTPDLAGYVDPNTISNEFQEKELEEISEKDKEFNNPCKSVIKDFDNDISYDDTDNAPEPGLLNDDGLGMTVSCNGQNVLIVFPSMSDYRVVRRVTAQYSKTIQTGNTSPSNKWKKSGGVSSNALSHAVNITDITPGETDINEENYSTQAGGMASPLKMFSATCDGFFLPIVPTLESMTATVDSAGLLVSYSYKDIPFKPKLERNLLSSVRTNISNRMS